jgi:hypothetical protein
VNKPDTRPAVQPGESRVKFTHHLPHIQQCLLGRRHQWQTLLLVLCVAVSGCTGSFMHANSQQHNNGLTDDLLQKDGLAFLTPSTVTGQEEDKQALAFVFANVVAQLHPKIHYVSLPETLSAINHHGLTDEYRLMYEQYRNTGIFKHELLKKVGQATGARYAVQLKLAGFKQGSEGRFGMFGWRIVDTQFAKIRLFMQIWDTSAGVIVWEMSHEMNYGYDSVQESGVTFRSIVEASANDILAKLPAANNPTEAIAGVHEARVIKPD